MIEALFSYYSNFLNVHLQIFYVAASFRELLVSEVVPACVTVFDFENERLS